MLPHIEHSVYLNVKVVVGPEETGVVPYGDLYGYVHEQAAIIAVAIRSPLSEYFAGNT